MHQDALTMSMLSQPQDVKSRRKWNDTIITIETNGVSIRGKNKPTYNV